MKTRIFVVVLVLGFGGWLLLLGIQWQFGLGRFADNPQELALLPGQRAIVGGGRAVVGFRALEPHRVIVEVQCAEDESRLELREGTAGDEVCGVQVRWIGAALGAAPGTHRFEISWEP